jgi:hypothetical protein
MSKLYLKKGTAQGQATVYGTDVIVFKLVRVEEEND